MPSSQVTVTADFAPEEQPEAGIPFTDVRKEDWFYPAVLYTYQANVMQGIGSQLFGPDQTISRAMVAQILYNIEGSPSISDAKTFQDVSLDAWYAPAVLWAANNHLVLVMKPAYLSLMPTFQGNSLLCSYSVIQSLKALMPLREGTSASIMTVHPFPLGQKMLFPGPMPPGLWLAQTQEI